MPVADSQCFVPYNWQQKFVSRVGNAHQIKKITANLPPLLRYKGALSSYKINAIAYNSSLYGTKNKTRGFCLESTHFVKPERLSKLI
jgi:hypothetical protein